MSWQSFVWIGLPLLAGALIPIQTGANRMVAVRLENALAAAGASMAIASVVLIVIGFSSLRQGAFAAALHALPIWAWACIWRYSASVSRPCFSSTVSGIATLPMSCAFSLACPCC